MQGPQDAKNALQRPKRDPRGRAVSIDVCCVRESDRRVNAQSELSPAPPNPAAEQPMQGFYPGAPTVKSKTAAPGGRMRKQHLNSLSAAKRLGDRLGHVVDGRHPVHGRQCALGRVIG